MFIELIHIIISCLSFQEIQISAQFFDQNGLIELILTGCYGQELCQITLSATLVSYFDLAKRTETELEAALEAELYFQILGTQIYSVC